MGIISAWIKQTYFEIYHMNPSWFIPVIGLILVAALGDFFPVWVQMFFSSVGGFFWIIFLSILLYRLIFHHPLPEKFIATLFILIAPPSMMTVSLVRMMQYGEVAQIFYWITVFFVFVLLTFLHWFVKISFDLSWWAYGFPVAAFVMASFKLLQAFDFFLSWIGVFFGVLLNVLLLILLTKTLMLWVQGKLFEVQKE
ncbi:MAG: hypothetical protein ACK4HQ_07950 [Brevinematales bacterium]